MERHLPAMTQRLAEAGFEMDLEPLRAVAAQAGAGAWRWDPDRRADLVNRAFASDAAAILDISGGDLSTEVLPLLDLELIAARPKLMVGYSDISAVLGALPFRSLLWKPRAGVGLGYELLERAIAGETLRPRLVGQAAEELARLPWAGGNLRCFLKLAGTRFWPSLAGKVLLIEALGTDLEGLASALAQHRLLGTFSLVAGVIVGQLTAIDDAGRRDEALALIREYTGDLPLCEAPGLGHSEDTEAATLG